VDGGGNREEEMSLKVKRRRKDEFKKKT